ncbi:NAD(P)/FAD-dependent oxidoreductase [Streptomyces dysideae]|uniref:FAD/NAD(P)-binding domain-containing protein n=1 Tax=Streptomyces dysideae TaxID=909626 RepID=A0A101UP46_9ACTN|nr:hypothetical protein [Streptomyces dysideae]KUO14320.1 hypothetical protein AQJ91_47540 [Streptomyces dysideae]
MASRTFVWTAGNRPGLLLARIGGVHAADGALIADAAFRVAGLENVWAIGDCAQIPDRHHDNAPYPPTGQHALRQGRAVADNIAAVAAGCPPSPFRFRTLGVLVALGHRRVAIERKTDAGYGSCPVGLTALLALLLPLLVRPEAGKRRAALRRFERPSRRHGGTPPGRLGTQPRAARPAPNTLPVTW